MTAAQLPMMHHVVLAVSPDRLTAVSAFFSELGFTFSEFAFEDAGLKVLLDWDRGLELVTPLPRCDNAVAEHLARHGDGVYSVVIRVANAPAAEEVAHRHTAVARFRQHRAGPGYELDEIELTVQGLPVTLLSTDLP